MKEILVKLFLKVNSNLKLNYEKLSEKIEEYNKIYSNQQNLEKNEKKLILEKQNLKTEIDNLEIDIKKLEIKLENIKNYLKYIEKSSELLNIFGNANVIDLDSYFKNYDIWFEELKIFSSGLNMIENKIYKINKIENIRKNKFYELFLLKEISKNKILNVLSEDNEKLYEILNSGYIYLDKDIKKAFDFKKIPIIIKKGNSNNIRILFKDKRYVVIEKNKVMNLLFNENEENLKWYEDIEYVIFEKEFITDINFNIFVNFDKEVLGIKPLKLEDNMENNLKIISEKNIFEEILEILLSYKEDMKKNYDYISNIINDLEIKIVDFDGKDLDYLDDNYKRLSEIDDLIVSKMTVFNKMNFNEIRYLKNSINEIEELILKFNLEKEKILNSLENFSINEQKYYLENDIEIIDNNYTKINFMTSNLDVKIAILSLLIGENYNDLHESNITDKTNIYISRASKEKIKNKKNNEEIYLEDIKEDDKEIEFNSIKYFGKPILLTDTGYEVEVINFKRINEDLKFEIDKVKYNEYVLLYYEGNMKKEYIVEKITDLFNDNNYNFKYDIFTKSSITNVKEYSNLNVLFEILKIRL